MNTVLSLPGVFVSCIQCFEYIQSGRTFEDDHKELSLHLDILQARLARWGHCVGILDDDLTLSSSQMEEKLKPHLESIIIKFEKAKEKATKSSPDRFVGKDPDPTRDSVRNDVRKWTNKYADKCLKGTTKVRWAIHDKKVLEDLVHNIRAHMNDMMHVFSSDEMEMLLARQRKLQENDLQSLKLEELHMLKRLAKDDDGMFVKMVEYTIRNRSPSSHNFNGTYEISGADEKFNTRLGDRIGRGLTGSGHNYSGSFKIGGSGTNSFGNEYC